MKTLIVAVTYLHTWKKQTAADSRQTHRKPQRPSIFDIQLSLLVRYR